MARGVQRLWLLAPALFLAAALLALAVHRAPAPPRDAYWATVVGVDVDAGERLAELIAPLQSTALIAVRVVPAAHPFSAALAMDVPAEL